MLSRRYVGSSGARGGREQSYGCSSLCGCVSRGNPRRGRRDLGLRGWLLGILLRLCNGLSPG